MEEGRGLIGGWIGEEGRRVDDGIVEKKILTVKVFFFLTDISDITLPALIESEWTGWMWVPLFNALLQYFLVDSFTPRPGFFFSLFLNFLLIFDTMTRSG